MQGSGTRGGRVRQSFTVFRKALALLRYSNRKLTLVVLGLTLAEILFTVSGFFAIKYVADLIARTGDLASETVSVFTGIAFAMALFLAARIFQSLANYHRSAQGYVVTDYVNQSIQERAVAADLSFYDSAHYYDTLERARQAGAGRPAQVIANIVNVLRSALMLTALGVILVSVEWLLLPIGALAVFLVLVVQVRFTRERFEQQRRLIQKERHATYADWLMTSEPFAKELRLWNLGPYLRKLYTDVRQNVRGEYLQIEWRKALSEIFVSVIGTGLFAFAGAFTIYRFYTGTASLSDVVLVLLLLLRAETVGRAFVANLSRLYDDRLFLDQLFAFLELAPKIEGSAPALALPASRSDGIRIENVTFSYPDSDTTALRDINLHIPPGRFTALVGGNGSGKTTLIKLITRLYDPQKGRILFNGADIRDLDPLAYREMFSVIFQDFATFAYSGRDNLQVSDLGGKPDDERMVTAARLSGAHEVFAGLRNGYDTLLSRMFDDGVELSGGQWQKVALARAIYPKSEFVILDEPTSAIDPNAEADLFDGFRQKLDGRGALVISHRLSTIRMADYTYVLEEGRIAEHGTHDTLTQNNGLYAAMFDRQGRGYRA
ncbi:MAG: ABC transporter ATP-binding protein [Pseudomonadota bacterium]